MKNELIFERIVVGPFQCNCVILGCAKTKEAVVIDPGDEGERIAEKIRQRGLTPKWYLHTHAHLDHIGGTKHLCTQWDCPPTLHKADQFIYDQLPMQGKMFGLELESAPPVRKFVEDGEKISFGGFSLEVIHTPGHSPGGVCYRLLGSHDQVFSGDTLFQGSIGRTDLWGGDTELLLRSIRERLFTLEDELPVHPGHGPSSKIGIEKRTNPFF